MKEECFIKEEVTDRGNSLLIFCKIEDITLDGEGNIHFFISKHRKESSMITLQLLQNWKGNDVCIRISRLGEGDGSVQDR